MCVACGQELCKNCKSCHNVECERYTEPTAGCGSNCSTVSNRSLAEIAAHSVPTTIVDERYW